MAGFILGVQLSDVANLHGVLADLDALDFVLAGDPLSPPALHQDPLSIAAWLMTQTRQVGLAAAVPTDWAPFNVARALASFDLLSGGRVGWMPITAADMTAERAAEHLDVVLQLFDSWDDDALVLDKAAGIFSDRAKVHRIRHQGAYYTVDGPLNAPRPPQGHPVLMQPAGGATTGADIVVGPLSQLPEPVAGQLRIAILPLDLSGGAAAVDALVRQITDLNADTAADGVLCAPNAAADIALLARRVAPRLGDIGLRQAAPSGTTFRERLGLPRPPAPRAAASRPVS